MTRQSSVASMACYFEPPPTFTALQLDTEGLETATAAGIATTGALVEWLRGNNAGVSIDPNEYAPFHNATSAKYSLHQTNFYARRLTVKRLAHVPSPQYEEVRASIELDAAAEAAAIAHEVAPTLSAPTVRAVEEFLVEGLANVAEHAIEGRSAQDISAFVAARVWTIDDVLLGYLEFDGFSPNEWFSRHATVGTRSFIEIAIADNGVGVAKSLADTYLKTYRDKNNLLQHRAGWWKIHDEILSWALSAFGSRKTPTDFAYLPLHRAWRGLYRVRFRAVALDGLVALRSSMGLSGVSGYGSDQREYRLATKASAADRFAMPWTTLTLVLPIDPKVAQRFRVDKPLHVSTMHVIPSATRPRPRSGALDIDTRLDDYAIAVKRTVRLAYANNSPEPHAPPTVGFAHPLISTMPTQRSAAVSGLHYFVHEKQADAVRLLRILDDTALPGAIPVHLLLAVTPEAVEEAQDYYAVHPKGARQPSVCALAASTDTRLYWFIHVDNEPAAARLARHGMITTGGGVPSWWAELLTLYPTMFRIVVNDGEHQLFFDAAAELTIESLETALLETLRDLASTRDVRTDWYWSARSPDAPEFVRTASGRLLRQFLSVNALCADEPVAEQVLGLSLSRRLDQITGDGLLILVSDTESASYLVSKRLLPSRSATLVVCHPDDFVATYQNLADTPGLRIAIFSDATYVGSRLSRRLAAVREHTDVVAAVTLFDLHPAATAFDIDVRIEALLRWPFPDPIAHADPDADVFEVDPITNEILSGRVIEEVKAYQSLLWSRPSTSAGADVNHADVLLQPYRFTYGYQWIGDRLHLIRCSTQRLLGDTATFTIVAEWLATIVLAEIPSGGDVVVITRDDTPFEADVNRLLAELSKRLLAKPWRGRLLRVTIETTRRRGRQILRHHLGTVFRDAVVVRDGQIPLFLAEDPPNSAPITVLYLDNATVTGRAIRDIALALTDLRQPAIRELVVCTLVNKLPPAEEQLIHHIGALNYTADNGGLPVKLFSLFQLRIPTFERFEATHISRLLSRLVLVAEGLDHVEVASWVRELLAIQQTVEAADRPLQCPLGPLDTPFTTVTVEAIYFRHLIAVYQDGFPVVDAVVSVLHALLQASDPSLIDVLALEPELLEETLLTGPFANEIGELAFSVLRDHDDPSHHVGRRRNALLVISQLPDFFVSYAREVASITLRSPELRPVLLGLCFALPSPAIRDRVLRRIAESDVDSSPYHPDDELQRAMVFVRAAVWTSESPRPLTRDDRLMAIEQLLRTARGHHKYGGYAVWWDAQILLSAGPSTRVSLSEGLSRIEWGELEIFAQTVLAPAVQALWHLSKRPPRSFSSPDALLRRIYAQLHDTRRACQHVSDKATSEQPAQHAWSELQRLSLSTAINVLYPQNRAAVLGITTSDTSLVDELLTAVVQEPCGLILHSIARYFGNDLPVRLTVHGMIEYRSHESITAHMRWLGTLWQGPVTLPVLVGNADDLRLCYQVFAHNIYVHGARDPEITLDIECRENRVLITLLNVADERRATHSQGRGSGLQQADFATRRLGGHLSTFLASILYRVRHDFPTRTIALPPRGEA